MQFTLYTDYSLRSLVYIALTTENPNTLTTISDISKCLNISNNHIVKVVHNLSKNGFLHTVRGNKGGIRLSRNPKEINLADVILKTENMTCLMHCSHDDCCFHKVCMFQSIMGTAARAFINELNKYHLSDLLKERKRLIESINKANSSSEDLCSLISSNLESSLPS